MRAMKIIMSILFFSVMNLPAHSQGNISKAKIKSITVLEEKNDMLVKKQYKESETWLDPQGNILEEIKYDQGKMIKHFRYQYDTDGNKIREEELDSSEKIRESSEYKFENGLRVEKTVYDQNKKMKSRKIYNYTTY
jgi:hypothetical protein